MVSLSIDITRIRVRCAVVLLGFCTFPMLTACGAGNRAEAARLAPIDCTNVPDLDGAVACVMNNFMSASDVTAATVTIVQNGKPLLDKGFGYQDAAKTIPLPANALMLTGSTVKPITAAAVQKLVAAGKLKLGDHAFCTGSNAPCWLSSSYLGAGSDARIGDVTVLQLLSMTSGFDPAVSGDPILREATIQKNFGLATPPQRADVLRYRLARPLDNAPGAKYAYANFNYLVLGAIIEQASGTDYIPYVNAQIFQPLGVPATDFVGAASLIKEHNPREPNYLCSETGPSVYAPGTKTQLNDGFIRASNWVSVGFALTTSKALALFGGNYQIWGSSSTDVPSDRTGTPLTTTLDQFAVGEWCGTQTLLRQRTSGVSYAVLMNKNSPDSDSMYAGTVKAALDKVLTQLKL